MLNYSMLRDMQRKETESSALVPVPEDFYEQVSALLSQRKSDALSTQSLMAIKEYENIRKIIVTIQLKREEKIVLLALRSEGGGAGLAKSEKEMLKALSEIIKRTRESMKNVWDNEGPGPRTDRRVKILKDISAYKGLDERTYGPFKEGEEISLPGSEAEWLLKAKMAEVL